MADDKIPTDEQAKPAKPEQAHQQAQQTGDNAAIRPDQRVAPGRKPLFRS